jgi:hypothetical protein
MGTGIELTKESRKKWKQALKEKAQAARAEGSKVVGATAKKVEAEVSEKIAKESTNTGQLLQSIYQRHQGLSAEVGATAAHAPYVEYGTGPHRPPFEPIYEWVWLKRHDMGIDDEDVWAVAKGVCDKIARLGTEETLHWTNTIKDNREWFNERMQKMIKEVIG